MGYDFHITRAANWTESESAPIRLDEWKGYVASHPEFRQDNFAEVRTPQGETLRYENEGLAVWTGFSRHGHEGNLAWFDWWRGRIIVKNADDEIRNKMKEIVKVFKARVVGDEGEEY